MRQCLPCNKRFITWHAFVSHMVKEHGIDRENLWRRANQIGDSPCIAVHSERGLWMIMVQGSLM